MVRERGGRWGTVGVVVFLVVVLILSSVPVGGTAPADSEAPRETLPLVGDTDLDPDSVLMAVALQEDGSAHWRVEYRIRLDDDNVTRAFDSLQADIEDDPASFAGPFADRMTSTAAAAENATGREMTIRNVSVSAERRQLPQEYGVVSYSFEWTGFAAVEGDRLRAGDAIAGLFLDPETTLLVSWPTRYQPIEITPQPDDRRDDAVSRTGRLDFTASEPRVVLSSAQPTETSAAGGGDGGGPAGPDDGDGDGGTGVDTGLLVIVILVALGIGAGGWWWRREASTGAAATDRGGEGEEPEGDPGGPDGPPEDLLSNEERVLSLLEERGGRMKQQEVAQALDWTDAKTSQVVGNLRDSGQIESFRLGRENVLSLPDDEPDEGTGTADRD